MQESPEHPLQRFQRSLGSLAVTRHGALWYAAGRFSLVTLPSNQRVAATKLDIQHLLVDCRKLVAVFCPSTGSGPVVPEYWVRTKDYGLDRLQHQFRAHVRKHAPQFVTRELTWDEMASGVGDLHMDTARRRRVSMPEFTDSRLWARACETAARTPRLMAYGCLVGSSLAGYVIAWREQDTCHGVLINRHSGFDAMRASNMLLYSFSRDQIARADTSAVNLGRSWYPLQPSLNSFKRHAGYEERGATVAVVLHPWVERVLRGSWTHRCLRRISALTGGWLNFESDLQIFEAARRTDIP